TGLAYVLQHAVIRAAGAIVASTVTYLIPLFAIAAGVVFLDESLTWNVFAGAFLVLVGAMLVNSRAGSTRPGADQAPTRRRADPDGARRRIPFVDGSCRPLTSLPPGAYRP